MMARFPRRHPTRDTVISARRLIVLSLSCALFLHAWVLLPAISSACPAVGDTAVVQRAIDGDTVELVGGALVRYLGIDAPELRTRRNGRWLYMPEPLAEEALLLNRRLVEGRKVRLEHDEELCDHYNRRLAYVFVDDMFVNGALVERGLAIVSIHPPNTKYASTLRKAESRARTHRIGQWATGTP
jgi:endonuclease YncB( thermonuclease family)